MLLKIGARKKRRIYQVLTTLENPFSREAIMLAIGRLHAAIGRERSSGIANCTTPLDCALYNAGYNLYLGIDLFTDMPPVEKMELIDYAKRMNNE